jgi:cytochrome c
MTANRLGGATPFDLKLTSKGTKDADGDPLKYSWKITSTNGFTKTINASDANLTLNNEGIYKVTLTVNDLKGGINTQSMEITAGNEPPLLSLDMPGSNKTFFSPNKTFKYDIKVSDKEDGDLGAGIDPENVSVNIDYLAEGFDKNMVAMGHRTADENIAFTKGRKLIEGSDCMACHKKDGKSIGPSYSEVSSKYKNNSGALEHLTKKIISGGSGVWGETAMAGHPQLSTSDAAEMAKYILNISNEKAKNKGLPVNGTYVAKVPKNDKGKGVFIVRASYEDQGANGISPLKSEKTFVLRNTSFDAHAFDDYHETNKMSFGGTNLAIPKNGSYMALKQIDLSGIKEIILYATAPKPQLNAAGGKVEARLGGPKGILIGVSSFFEPSEKMDFSPKPLSIPISSIQLDKDKMQDIYLVFQNTDAGVNSLMVVMSAEVKLADNGAVETPIEFKSTSSDYFVGQWTTKLLGTPAGDIEVNLNLTRLEGKLTGTMKSKGQGDKEQAIDKIEEESPEKVKIFFQANGMALNMIIEKDDNENFSGKLMGMFDVKGIRLK